MEPTEPAPVITLACRMIGQEHDQCAGHIFLGSIFRYSRRCECECHNKEGAQGEQQ